MHPPPRIEIIHRNEVVGHGAPGSVRPFARVEAISVRRQSSGEAILLGPKVGPGTSAEGLPARAIGAELWRPAARAARERLRPSPRPEFRSVGSELRPPRSVRPEGVTFPRPETVSSGPPASGTEIFRPSTERLPWPRSRWKAIWTSVAWSKAFGASRNEAVGPRDGWPNWRSDGWPTRRSTVGEYGPSCDKPTLL